MKKEATSHLHLDFQSLVKMDDAQATLADMTFNFVNTLLCYANEKNNRVSNMDIAITFLIAANVVSQSSDETQSVVIAKIAETPYISGVVENVCQSLQCDSGRSNILYILRQEPVVSCIYPFVGVSGEQYNVMLSMFVECIMQWTHFNSLLCKEFGKAGVLHFLTTILRAYTKSKPPNEVCGI